MARKPANKSVGQDSACEPLRLVLSAHEPQIERRREITTAVYAIAQKLGWDLGEFHWRTYPASYFHVDFRHGDRHFILAIDWRSPVVALAHNGASYADPLAFFDDAAFVEAVEAFGRPFIVLSSQDLTKYPTAADRSLIAAHPEIYTQSDMAQWKPQRVGDIIFNWW